MTTNKLHYVKMKKMRIGAGMVLILALLFTADARGDFVTSVNWYSDKSTYMNSVSAPDWAFGTFTQIGDDFNPRTWEFAMRLNDGVHSTGTFTMVDFNGAGGLMQEPQGGSGTMSFWHNSANEYDISFGDADFVNSFYLDVAPHSSWSAAITFAVTAEYWLDGVQYATEPITIDQNQAFFGIALDDGAHLSGINFWSTGTPNNGYKITAGFGGDYDGDPNVVPEPATLAVLGLGLAGLGLARRRRK